VPEPEAAPVAELEPPVEEAVRDALLEAAEEDAAAP